MALKAGLNTVGHLVAGIVVDLVAEIEREVAGKPAA